VLSVDFSHPRKSYFIVNTGILLWILEEVGEWLELTFNILDEEKGEDECVCCYQHR
jgi:hypothetical protein